MDVFLPIELIDIQKRYDPLLLLSLGGSLVLHGVIAAGLTLWPSPERVSEIEITMVEVEPELLRPMLPAQTPAPVKTPPPNARPVAKSLPSVATAPPVAIEFSNPPLPPQSASTPQASPIATKIKAQLKNTIKPAIPLQKSSPDYQSLTSSSIEKNLLTKINKANDQPPPKPLEQSPTLIHSAINHRKKGRVSRQNSRKINSDQNQQGLSQSGDHRNGLSGLGSDFASGISDNSEILNNDSPGNLGHLAKISPGREQSTGSGQNQQGLSQSDDHRNGLSGLGSDFASGISDNSEILNNDSPGNLGHLAKISPGREQSTGSGQNQQGLSQSDDHRNGLSGLGSDFASGISDNSEILNNDSPGNLGHLAKISPGREQSTGSGQNQQGLSQSDDHRNGLSGLGSDFASGISDNSEILNNDDPGRKIAQPSQPELVCIKNCRIETKLDIGSAGRDRMRVQIQVAPTGQVLAANITKSSGNPDLDDIAIKGVQQMEFAPTGRIETAITRINFNQ